VSYYDDILAARCRALRETISNPRNSIHGPDENSRALVFAAKMPVKPSRFNCYLVITRKLIVCRKSLNRESEAALRYGSQALLPVDLCSNFNPHSRHPKLGFFC
jgi:hypothetical protein